MIVGVLAVQGAFSRHVQALQRCGVEAITVRTPAELGRCSGLIIPGGESTTIGKLLVANSMVDPLRNQLAGGLPVFGTCAGLIMLADSIVDGRSDQLSFSVIDLDVQRNFYGRQVDSFEANVGLVNDPVPFSAVFIRAPGITRVGAEVNVWAEHNSQPVLCQQGSVVVSTFHPELTDDDRIHRRFLELIV